MTSTNIFQIYVPYTVYPIRKRRRGKWELLIWRFKLHPFKRGWGGGRKSLHWDSLVTCTRSDRKWQQREKNFALLTPNLVYIRLNCPLGLAEIKDQTPRKCNIYSQSITELNYPKPRQNIKVIRSHKYFWWWFPRVKTLYTVVSASHGMRHANLSLCIL